jgi:hypothetical protein
MNEIDARLEELHQKWRAETSFQSNIKRILENENYKQIVALGPPVVPFIIERIRSKTSFLVFALFEIMPDKVVVPENYRGRFEKICNLWVKAWDAEHPPTAESLSVAAQVCVYNAVKSLQDTEDVQPEYRNSWIDSAIKQLMRARRMNVRANKLRKK